MNHNRNSAIEDGIYGLMWYDTNLNGSFKMVSTQDALREDLKRAREGLMMLGIQDRTAYDHFSLLYKNLSEGSPSKRFADSVRIIKTREGVSQKEALDIALRDFLVQV